MIYCYKSEWEKYKTPVQFDTYEIHIKFGAEGIEAGAGGASRCGSGSQCWF
jgi:hypothetical protein